MDIYGLNYLLNGLSDKMVQKCKISNHLLYILILMKIWSDIYYILYFYFIHYTVNLLNHGGGRCTPPPLWFFCTGNYKYDHIARPCLPCFTFTLYIVNTNINKTPMLIYLFKCVLLVIFGVIIHTFLHLLISLMGLNSSNEDK